MILYAALEPSGGQDRSLGRQRECLEVPDGGVFGEGIGTRPSYGSAWEVLTGVGCKSTVNIATSGQRLSDWAHVPLFELPCAPAFFFAVRVQPPSAATAGGSEADAPIGNSAKSWQSSFCLEHCERQDRWARTPTAPHCRISPIQDRLDTSSSRISSQLGLYDGSPVELNVIARPNTGRPTGRHLRQDVAATVAAAGHKPVPGLPAADMPSSPEELCNCYRNPRPAIGQIRQERRSRTNPNHKNVGHGQRRRCHEDIQAEVSRSPSS